MKVKDNLGTVNSENLKGNDRGIFQGAMLGMYHESEENHEKVRTAGNRARFEPSTSRIQSGAIFLGVQYEYERVLLRAK